MTSGNLLPAPSGNPRLPTNTLSLSGLDCVCVRVCACVHGSRSHSDSAVNDRPSHLLLTCARRHTHKHTANTWPCVPFLRPSHLRRWWHFLSGNIPRSTREYTHTHISPHPTHVIHQLVTGTAYLMTDVIFWHQLSTYILLKDVLPLWSQCGSICYHGQWLNFRGLTENYGVLIWGIPHAINSLSVCLQGDVCKYMTLKTSLHAIFLSP